MPWDVVKVGNKYVVENKMTGRIVARHGTKAEAERQLRALYANVHDMPGYKGTANNETKKKLIKETS